MDQCRFFCGCRAGIIDHVKWSIDCGINDNVLQDIISFVMGLWCAFL